MRLRATWREAGNSKARPVLIAGVIACCIAAANAKAGSQPPEIEGLYSFHGAIAMKGLKWAREPAPEAVRLINLIIDSVGIAQNINVWAGDFEERQIAVAGVSHDRRRHIIYDVEEFSFGNGRTSWRAVGVLSHEIGHLLASHAVARTGTSHERELEADRFAGVAVARLGGTLGQALSWLPMVSEQASDSHPGRARRIVAVTEGWHHGEAMKKRETPACKTDWAGKPLMIERHQCRIARRCSGAGESYALACQNFDGGWNWVKARR